MKRFLILSLSIFLYSGMSCAFTNLTFVKEELAQYYESGAYFSEIESVIDQAKQNLIHQVHQRTAREKLAIVFDIDDTVISNYPLLKMEDFGGSYDIRLKLVMKGGQPVIPAALSLYKLALEKNVHVFFVTGRPLSAKEVTEKVLNDAGFTTWVGIYYKPETYNNKPASEYKSVARKKIMEQGYKIIENIGDQYSDLIGGYALATYKLPNPFYYIG